MTCTNGRVLTVVAGALASSLVMAAGTQIEGSSGEAEKVFREKAAAVPQIERIIEMDAEKIRAIRSVDGRTMFMVDNGRFVFVGDMFDMWQRKRLKTMDDIAEAVRKIDLKGAGFDLENANKFSLGKGKKQVTVFVDPQCGWCHKLIEEVSSDAALLEEYAFDFVVIPVLGPQSEKLARLFSCTSENDMQKRLEAFQKGAEGIEALPLLEKCDGSKYQQTRTSAEILGIHSAPLVVAHDGRFARGKPKSMAAFLNGTSSDGGKDMPMVAPKKLSPEEAKAAAVSMKEKWKAEAKAAAQEAAK